MAKLDKKSNENRSNAPIGIKERLDYNEDFRLDWRDPDEAHDGYQLKWIGKDYARLQTGIAPDTVIVPNEKHNAQPKNAVSENIFLTGDNLQVLKHLQSAYRGAIKMIYIDPPYNTGSNDFIYSDKFEFSDEQLRNMLGMTDKEIARLHTLNGRSSHSAWLTFMYPRLRLAQNLLSEDGVIFISIDDNEQANLKLLCDEIFGEGNFLGQIVWQTATDNNPTQVATEHEYVLVFAKNAIEQDFWEIPSEKGKIIQTHYESLKFEFGNDVDAIQKALRKWLRKQSNGDNLSGVAHYSYVDEKGVFYPGNSANTKPGGYTFDIIHPAKKKVCAKPAYGYRWTKETFDRAAVNGDVLFGHDETIIPKIKKRLGAATEKLKSYYYEDNRSTTGELKRLFDNTLVFNNPKSVQFLRHIARFVTDNEAKNTSPLILDFFAGSGTTAHAVMQLNKEDSGNRKWILCNWAEPTKQDSEARKAGYETIDEISRERIKRAADQLSDTSGFRHYYVQEPAAETIDKIEEFDPAKDLHIVEDMAEALGESTILTTWLAADGYQLTYPVQTIDFKGYNAYYIDNSLLYIIAANWGKEQTQELLNQVGTNKMNLNTIVVFGYSLTLESMKELEINVAQNLDRKVVIEKRW